MGVSFVILCLILQILTTTEAATLPLTDLVAKAPKKPCPPLAGSQLSDNSNALEYYTSPVCEFASPLALTSSKPLPIPRVADISNEKLLANLRIAESNPYKSSSVLAASKTNVPDLSLPTASSKISSPNLPSPKVTPSPLSPLVPNKCFTPPSTENLVDPLSATDVNDKLSSLLRSVSSLPSVPIASLQRSLDSIAEISRVKNSFLSLPTYSQATFEEVPWSPMYSNPYLLRYDALSLPSVVPTIQPKEKTFTESPSSSHLLSNLPVLTPNSYKAPIRVPPAKTFSPASNFPGVNLNSPQFQACLKLLNQERSEKKAMPFTSYDITPLTTQNDDTKMHDIINENNYYSNGLNPYDNQAIDLKMTGNLANIQTSANDNIQNSVPAFDQVLPTQYLIPDVIANTRENLPPTGSYLQNTQETLVIPSVPPKTISPPKVPLVSTIPAPYLKVSPTNSISKTCSEMVSSINDYLSTITLDILSSYPSSGLPSCNYQRRPQSNSYALRRKPKRVRKLKKSRRLVKSPVVSQLANLPVFLSCNPSPSSTFISSELEPLATSSFLSVPSMTSAYVLSEPALLPSLISYSNDNSLPSVMSCSPCLPVTDSVQLTDLSSITPVNVSILPPISLSDYIPSHTCPTYLPSPVITTSTSPKVMEPEVIAKKDSKSKERLAELFYLAELLKGNGCIDLSSLV